MRLQALIVALVLVLSFVAGAGQAAADSSRAHGFGPPTPGHSSPLGVSWE